MSSAMAVKTAMEGQKVGGHYRVTGTVICKTDIFQWPQNWGSYRKIAEPEAAGDKSN